MKPFYFVVVAVLLSACFDVPVDEATLPKQAADVVVPVPEGIIEAQKQEKLQYQPIAKTRTRYYDARGQLVEHATKGGFYREVLGRTQQERLVLQDFYQDSGQPYTLPFVAVKDAQLKIFEGAAVRDGRTVWLKPDGSLLRVADFKNGQAIGETWFFDRNKAVAYLKHLPAPQSQTVDINTVSAVREPVQTDKKINKKKPDLPKKDKGKKETEKIPATQPEKMGAALMRFFYPNGQLMAEIETDGNQQYHIVLYYPSGAAMLQIDDNGSHSSRTAWDNTGKTVAPSSIGMETDAVVLRLERGLQLVGREHDKITDMVWSQ